MFFIVSRCQAMSVSRTSGDQMPFIRIRQAVTSEVDLQTTYDAVVVGSGAAGGMAAHVLTSQGMKVLMLEAGKKLDINSELKSTTAARRPAPSRRAAAPAAQRASESARRPRRSRPTARRRASRHAGSTRPLRPSAHLAQRAEQGAVRRRAVRDPDRRQLRAADQRRRRPGAGLMVFMYLPMSYYTDKFLYNRRQRQKQAGRG